MQTALVFALALFGWHSATTQLASEFAANRGKIMSEFDSVGMIMNQVNHPNEIFEKETKRLTRELKKDVRDAWTYVYADQKSKVLKWPAALGKDFLEWFDHPANHNKEIPHVYREMYTNYIKKEFSQLLEIVDAKPYWEPDEATSGTTPVATRGLTRARGEAGAGGGPVLTDVSVPKKDYLVKWEAKDQEAIESALNFSSTPDSQTVRFCQENLWVYNALLSAVASVNKNSTGNHNAKIKEIISIAIAQEASAILLESLANGRIVVPDGVQAVALTPNVGPPTGSNGEPAPMADEMPGRGFNASASGNGRPLDDQRYLDQGGLPLAFGVAGPAEFKRLPIVLRLRIDQREISDLLVALANSPLPVDVRQVRINTKISGYTNSVPSMFGGKDASSGGRSETSLYRPGSGGGDSYQNPYDVGIELHGIIYIFNPPDNALSSKGSVG